MGRELDPLGEQQPEETMSVHQRKPVPVVIGVLVCMLVLACSAGSSGEGSQPSAGPSAESRAESPAGEAIGVCELFTPAELAALLGAEPGPGVVAGPLDSGCQWEAGETDVMLQKVAPRYFEDRDDIDGYRELQGIGDYAYVAPYTFGRIAAALTVDAGYFVVASETTAEEQHVELLRAFVERSPGNPELSIATSAAETPPPLALPSVQPADCLVTTEQVAAAAGIDVVGGAAPCSWQAADAQSGLFEVYLMSVPIVAFSGADGDPVAGVGDEAYYGDFGELYVRVGDRAFSVQVLASGQGLPDGDQVAIAIAHDAVENLP